MEKNIEAITAKYRGDATRLMDILIDIQDELGCLTPATVARIAGVLGIPQVDVEQTVSFYHFFAREPRGRFAVYLNDSVVANFYGRAEVAAAFEIAAGCRFGEVSADGLLGLFHTACIGMSDQEPAALINGQVFPRLTPDKARALVAGMRAGKTIEELKGDKYGDGQNSHPLVRALVKNHIRQRGPTVFSDYTPGIALAKVTAMTSAEVIAAVKSASVRGRGGAGFPTGMKWEFARRAPGDVKYIFCNADEGEPGTFKDRVILTERPQMVFEGMAIAAYAVGADHGILYVRNEYRYLRAYLEQVLAVLRAQNLLGERIGGQAGFDFDISIHLGAGAYVCGEESALIESAEGKRGEPRDRPPFPVEKGYLQRPTVVNNVETLCSAVQVVLKGAEWYNRMGTEQSKGTKVLCVSGDCDQPGIYEVEWGFAVNDILAMAKARDVQAVQVGGPSGACIGPDEFGRVLAYEDLATGGSFIIIGRHRDILRDVVLNFARFFREESCGSCVPCRALTGMAQVVLERIIAGQGTAEDVARLQAWQKIMRNNRCGLGQTALNPIVTTIRNFRPLYEARLSRGDPRFVPSFDLPAAVRDYEAAVANG
ncbi:MAG TPA: NAD(P)H-dependent oxidoreductase subunit E [Kiritimatiellia bacterium]|nr:NAD(P)H-dependent oxidoreductase subunit E [Kiritimatiellia bacterium]